MNKELDTLLNKLKKLTKDTDIELLFDLVPTVTTQIDNLELTSNYFIDSVLEVIEDKNINSMARICLTTVLNTLPMQEYQVYKILELIKDESYCEGLRSRLIESLNMVLKLGNKIAIEELYSIYKKSKSLQKKVLIGELLLDIEELHFTIESDLLTSLKEEKNQRETLASRLTIVNILKENQELRKTLVEYLLYILENEDFSEDQDGFEFGDVIDSFLAILPTNEELDVALKLMDEDYNEWEIYIFNELKKYPNEIDFYLDGFKNKNEDFSAEEASNVLTRTILNIEETNRLLEYLESDLVTLATKEKISHTLGYMPKNNPIDIERLKRIYSQTGLNKEIYKNIKEVLKERKKLENGKK